MVTLSIIVPMRPDNGYRDRAWEWVRRRWQYIAPDAEIVTADSDGDTFSYAQAANRAVAKSSGDVFLFAGLEQTVDRYWPRHAMANVANGRWCRQAICHMLTETESARYLTMPPDTPLEAHNTEWSGPASLGMAMFTRQQFDLIGGYDERHEGWGWEDCCLAIAAETLLGPPVTFGQMWHFWHPATHAETWIQPHCDEQKSLFHRYEAAQNNPDAMRVLIGER